MPKVSVIIPVYGVEKYIERCARSLFEQTLDDIEYLFINDCTKDKSVEVLLRTLDDNPHRKPQVRVITMEQNSGQAAVRRKGMLEAKGEFQIHCDSDDWVELDMYEKMYDKAKESDADIVTCNFRQEQGGGKYKIVSNLDNSDPRHHINYVEQNVWWTLWARMIRTELIKEHNIYPIPGMNMWEDMFVNLRVYYYAEKLVHIPEPFYHYDTSRDGNIVAKRLESSVIQQQITCLTQLTTFFEEVGFNASKFLEIRKRAVKSKFLLKKPIDYRAFQNCFPEITKYNNETLNLYKYCWEKAAVGKTIPFRLLSVYYNILAMLFSKTTTDC